MTRRLRALGLATLVAVTVAVPAARGASGGGQGSVVASVTGTSAVLGNSRVRREWRVTAGPAGGIVTTALVDRAGGRSWAGPASSDFSLTVDGVPLTSTGVWEV